MAALVWVDQKEMLNACAMVDRFGNAVHVSYSTAEAQASCKNTYTDSHVSQSDEKLNRANKKIGKQAKSRQEIHKPI